MTRRILVERLIPDDISARNFVSLEYSDVYNLKVNFTEGYLAGYFNKDLESDFSSKQNKSTYLTGYKFGKQESKQIRKSDIKIVSVDFEKGKLDGFNKTTPKMQTLAYLLGYNLD